MPMPHRLGLILDRTEGYLESHGIIIIIHALSSKIINTDPIEDYSHITVRKQKWIDKPYVVESSNSKEKNVEEDDEEDARNELSSKVVQRGSTTPLVETIEPLIQDEISPRLASSSPEAGIVPPILICIKTAAFQQDDQEESSSNLQTVVLSQLSLIV
ncbi:unnamed protein product [Lactuca saligna]|uniref:Uncharacterized protein n=1 Tax=Lactuca saligna TaxID=75948 RepID=A0AA36E9Y1_LACSI|nr:unnamed protein product [Lactuca saligna]